MPCVQLPIVIGWWSATPTNKSRCPVGPVTVSHRGLAGIVTALVNNTDNQVILYHVV